MLKLLIPPPVYLLSFAVLMWIGAKVLPLWQWNIEPWNQGGIVLVICAILIDVWSLGLFFRAKTTFNPIKPNKTTELVTTGLYQYSRNPMYLGMVIILLGWGIYLSCLSAFLLIPLFMWVLTEQQIKPEEQVLQKKFGDAYHHYQQQVPRWL